MLADATVARNLAVLQEPGAVAFADRLTSAAMFPAIFAMIGATLFVLRAVAAIALACRRVIRGRESCRTSGEARNEQANPLAAVSKKKTPVW